MLFGRKTKTTRELDSGEKLITQFAYDAGNNLVSITANNNITRYEYDTVFKRNWLTKVIYPDNTFIEYTYDLNGNVLTEKQRNGTVVTNTYNDLNLLTNRAIQPAAGVLDTTAETYEYDGASRLTKATDNDSTVIFGYDSLNRKTSENQNGKLIQYTYDKVNNLTSIQYPNQRIIEREFDVLNRINKIKQGGTDIANMAFIGRTYRMLSKGYQNGDVVKYLYDAGRRNTSIEAKNLNQQIINQYAYGYNKVNLKNYEQRLHDASKGDVYAYDAINRIKNIKFDAADPTDPLTAQFAKAKTYNLDKVDNILKIVENKNSVDSEILTEMTGNSAQLNQYTKFDQWNMAYDQNGNTTQKGSQQFAYNFRNQLVRAIVGGSTITMKYDPFGRRIEKTGSGNTIKFYYAGNQVIEERNGSDLVTKQYVYGNGIDELFRLDVYSDATSTPYYVHTNDIGSTTAITDGTGALVERVSYDTFGLPSFTNASGQPIASSSIGNTTLFQGREFDPELNLYNYRARYYDPIMGRFLQTDPVGYQDSMNLYQGMNMNPGNLSDPFGKWFLGTHSSITEIAFERTELLIHDTLKRESTSSDSQCRRIIKSLEQNMKYASELPDWGYDEYNLVENKGGQFHTTYGDEFKGGAMEFRNLIISTALINLVKANRLFYAKSKEGISKYWDKQFAVTLLGEALHMIQDSYAPAHVKRNDKMQIKFFRNYKQQNSSTLIIIPFGKHQWDDTYDEEHKKLYFEAVNASEKILKLFFSRNGPDFKAKLINLLNDILNYNFGNVVSNR
jgi:RHS repeat-associated protein